MPVLSLLSLLALLGQAPAAGVHERSFQLPGGRTMLYGLSIPRGYDSARPSPLILALHSGGPPMRYYGKQYMELLVKPALDGMRPIILAPDCPTRSWTDPESESAVMALVEDAMSRYAIDRRYVLVTGFSMGGRGTWHLASRHPKVFTGAIPMAASPGEIPVDRLGLVPTAVVHSRDDEVVPFEPAEKNARQLAAMGRDVRFEAVEGITHFQMFMYVDALERAGRWIWDRWGEIGR